MKTADRRTSVTLDAWSPAVVAVLLAVAAAAALVRTAAGDGAVRSAGAVTAALLVWCGYGAVRRRVWAVGTSFFIGLFWFVSAGALGVQGRLAAAGAGAWVAWALVVMAASVRAGADARQDLHPSR